MQHVTTLKPIKKEKTNLYQMWTQTLKPNSQEIRDAEVHDQDEEEPDDDDSETIDSKNSDSEV